MHTRKELKLENNQTVKADAGKLKLSLVPPQIIRDIAQVREYGNNKYPEGGPDNWKNVEKERYRDALFRHFLAYLEDPHGVDEESGIEHYKHMACNMAFLCEMENAEKRLQGSCTANFVAEQLDRLRKMTDEEKWEFFKRFFKSEI